MKKLGTWLLNHLGLILGIVTFTITFAVIGFTMLGSYTNYLAYEKQFNETDLEIRSLSGAQPKFIEMQDNFKSEYKNTLVLGASDLKVTSSQEDYMIDDYIDLTTKGGKISTKLSLEQKSFVDIDFEISTQYVTKGEDGDEFGIKDLMSNVQIVVNGETMEEEGIDLVEEGWHHLVMVSFALPAGDVTVDISSLSGKTALMPQLKSVTFYSSAVLQLAEEAA